MNGVDSGMQSGGTGSAGSVQKGKSLLEVGLERVQRMKAKDNSALIAGYRLSWFDRDLAPIVSGVLDPEYLSGYLSGFKIVRLYEPFFSSYNVGSQNLRQIGIRISHSGDGEDVPEIGVCFGIQYDADSNQMFVMAYNNNWGDPSQFVVGAQRGFALNLFSTETSFPNFEVFVREAFEYFQQWILTEGISPETFWDLWISSIFTEPV